jgi:hypothetical protein
MLRLTHIRITIFRPMLAQNSLFCHVIKHGSPEFCIKKSCLCALHKIYRRLPGASPGAFRITRARRTANPAY